MPLFYYFSCIQCSELFVSELKHKRIRYRLKVAIKAKDKYKLEYTITEFKDEKVEDKDMELERAERLLKELVTRDSKYSSFYTE